MTRNELDYFNAMHDSLFGALHGPATQGRDHSKERVVPFLNPRVTQPRGLSDQSGEAGASASPTRRDGK